MRSIVIFCNMMLGLLVFITSSNCAHANSAPEMTVNGEMGTRGFIDVFELNTFVVDVITSDDTDSEGSGLTYSLTPEPYIRDGVTLPEDNDDFTIDANTGVLRFKLSPDFEVPTDSNGDNVYSINIKVTDSGGLSDYFFLIVQVFDTDESQPTVSIYAPSGHNAQPFDVSIGSNKSFDHIKPQLTDVVVTNGTAAKRNNDPLLELTVTPSGNSPVTITIPGGSITDQITGQIVTEVTQIIVPFDVTPPSITSIVRLQNSPTSADSLMWRITLSEYVRVTGLGSALSVTGTTALVQPTLVDTISLGALQTGVKVFDVTISGGDLANLEDKVVLNFDPVAAGLKDAVNLSFVSSVPTGANEITYFVTQDNVAPTLTPVTIYSDNADPTVAVPGDTVTVKFSASEALVSPPTAVTIAGQPASLIGVSPHFKATLLVDATTPKGGGFI